MALRVSNLLSGIMPTVTTLKGHCLFTVSVQLFRASAMPDKKLLHSLW